MADTRSLVYLAIGILFFLVELGLAAAAFYRFRVTASGIVLGGAFILMALKDAAIQVLTRTVLSGSPFNEERYLLFQIVSGSLSFLLLIAVAVGIVLIPLSLRRLSQQT